MKNILKKLKEVEKNMRKTAALMMDHANPEVNEKGKELFGASFIAKGWIKNIEKEIGINKALTK